MDIRDEMAASKRKLKIDSSSTQVDDADDSGSRKKKSNYKKSVYNKYLKKVLQPTPAPNTKSYVRRISKEVLKKKRPVKPKVAPVKRKRVVKPKAVGKNKRLDEYVASKEAEDEEVVSDEDGDDVDE
ncbi:hypothetical protein Tco_0488593 [Tanacetum coccineum]